MICPLLRCSSRQMIIFLYNNRNMRHARSEEVTFVFSIIWHGNEFGSVTTFRRCIGKGGNARCGSPGNLHADGHECSKKREREELRGLSLAVKIADNRNYSDTHGPPRARVGGLSVTRRACITPNCTRARASTSAACLSEGKCYIVLDFRRY